MCVIVFIWMNLECFDEFRITSDYIIGFLLNTQIHTLNGLNYLLIMDERLKLVRDKNQGIKIIVFLKDVNISSSDLESRPDGELKAT